MKENRAYNILQRLWDNTLPAEQRRAVKRWLVSDNDPEEKETALSRIWQETSAEADHGLDESLLLTWQKIQHSEKKTRQRGLVYHLLRYAAIVLLVVATGITTWKMAERQYEETEMIECFVPNGEQQSVTLPDGSHIQLNAGTVFIYPSSFTGGKRTVYLSGEARFSIEKDENNPFIVNTGNLKVEVLGTTFNVEAYPGSGSITTTLEEGAVKVYKELSPQEAIYMKPNEQLTYISHDDRFQTALVDASDYAAWTTGELRFINRSLDEILFSLERKYDVRFLVDPEIQSVDLYTVKYKSHETIEDAIYVLSEIIGDIDYRQEGQTIRLFLKRKGVRR